MRLVLAVLGTVVWSASWVSHAPAQGLTNVSMSDRSHESAEWADIERHLPDAATSTPTELESAADTLRARRYPEDAMRLYTAAIARGGDQRILLNKSGITCLEMQQVVLARTFFQQAVQFRKRDAAAWNNLGAAEFMLHNSGAAVKDYKHAVKLQNTSAVFHGNLALAYFETRHTDAARRELAEGLALDPDLLHKGGRSGFTAQVLASARYAEMCFEMARLYATQGNMEAVLDWLTKASDRGYDVHAAMAHDPALRPLLAEARVQMLLKNKQQLEAKSKAPANIPSLGRAEP